MTLYRPVILSMRVQFNVGRSLGDVFGGLQECATTSVSKASFWNIVFFFPSDHKKRFRARACVCKRLVELCDTQRVRRGGRR